MSRSLFAWVVVAGILLRAAALPGRGTGDVTVWKVWSYNAARHGVGEMYGVGGTPPERRELEFAGAKATVDYPPLALYELGLVGHAYWAWSHRHFPNATPLNAFVKLPGVAAEIGLALLLFATLRRQLGIAAARLTAAAYWLNPAALIDASILLGGQRGRGAEPEPVLRIRRRDRLCAAARDDDDRRHRDPRDR